MPTTPTDVSTAQTFNVASFLSGLVNTGAQIAQQKIAQSQNTGAPAASVTPPVVAAPGSTQVPAGPGGSLLSSPMTMALLVGGGLLALYLVARKS